MEAVQGKIVSITRVSEEVARAGIMIIARNIPSNSPFGGPGRGRHSAGETTHEVQTE